MTKIIVVCGAGASSTFLAHRINRRAGAAHLSLSAQAATASDYLLRLADGDVLLVGPQLGAQFDEITERAHERHAYTALLPATIYGPGGDEEALSIADGLIASADLDDNDENSDNHDDGDRASGPDHTSRAE
ncbi:PTS sugar transporter [Microbacterium sp. STN6]|uniref:PTS sugar transporter subunit IIB n=1 Tax=Microbacterium sp. STN6 TaxID=2995588 RepID=UPI002260E141|nr:PTS sugar transporter [Microbacterium sp. STN6]MCX7523231.1 PTS sugar transporter [Microbacterium sp. STN6]